MSASRCVVELIQIQRRWTALQCLYHDPEVRLKQPKAARQFAVCEQQLLHVLRQMKEARGVMVSKEWEPTFVRDSRVSQLVIYR